MRSFEQRLATWSRIRGGVPVVTGVMFDQRQPSLIVEQVKRARRTGRHFSAFAYNSLFERQGEGGRPALDDESRQRAARRKAMLVHLRDTRAAAR